MTTLNNAQYNFLLEILPQVKTKPFKYSPIELFNLMVKRVRTGCQWRSLGKIWRSVYYHFCKWSKLDIFKSIIDKLANKSDYLVVDTQSVKNTCLPEVRGCDGHKKVKGIKRVSLTNQDGVIIYTKVFPAQVNDSKILFNIVTDLNKYNNTINVYADKGFSGQKLKLELMTRNINFTPMKKKLYHDKSDHPIARELIKLEKEQVSNYNKQISKRRFVVERSFAWLQNYRLLNLNYEKKATTHESWVYLASAWGLLKRY
jgi:putative transposase